MPNKISSDLPVSEDEFDCTTGRAPDWPHETPDLIEYFNAVIENKFGADARLAERAERVGEARFKIPA